MTGLEALIPIAVDLTSSLAAVDRYDRLLRVVRRVVDCDAATLMRLEGRDLVPLAARGLVPEAMGRRYALADHPRLAAVVDARRPLLFPPDSPLPDPFDGLLVSEPTALGHIHACLGCPLLQEDQVIGVLTADALAAGAFDHLEPAFLEALGALAGAAMRTTSLIEALERSSRRHGLVAQDLLRDATARSGGHLIGTSPAMERLRQEIDSVAGSDFAVLIHGETGTGKELVARAIHAASARAGEPLIHVNCAALPESVAESELFGHLRGSFTGAIADRAGKLEVADGGTLLLDEIGELPLSIQPKLLRAVQEGEIQRVGSDRLHRVNVRLLAATNRDLEREVAAGRFRADLFHRLNVYPLRVPPLRERRSDIPLLAGYFLDELRRRLGLKAVRLSEPARTALRDAGWPGNVRELEHALARAILRAGVGAPRGAEIWIEPQHLHLEPPRADDAAAVVSSPTPPVPMREAVRKHKRALIEDALAASGGNWSAAARKLGMHRSNLHNLAKRLGLRA